MQLQKCDLVRTPGKTLFTVPWSSLRTINTSDLSLILLLKDSEAEANNSARHDAAYYLILHLKDKYTTYEVIIVNGCYLT